MSTEPDTADFVVLHTDGRVVYLSAEPGRPLREAINAYVPNLASRGLGQLRVWFADDFGALGLYTNPLADSVTDRLGYPYDWYGPVALSMEEDVHGVIVPLAGEVRETITELAYALNAGDLAAAARYAPELLDDLMYMSSIDINGRTVYQYKHCDTRRYLNLDMTGQAWRIANADGQMFTRPMDISEAKSFVALTDPQLHSPVIDTPPPLDETHWATHHPPITTLHDDPPF
ncbi:hypothetical protein AB0C34_17430 [Nocardia sp. NPDC049220]|uniref:hypothetical protein n=1 Tax=Nocardia sp. NPDC049220 TaxID=3155273 RepID=UPI0033FEA596